MKFLVFPGMLLQKTLKKHITNWQKNTIQIQIKVTQMLAENSKKFQKLMK
jgi:hypothetical protein